MDRPAVGFGGGDREILRQKVEFDDDRKHGGGGPTVLRPVLSGRLDSRQEEWGE